MTRLHDVLSVIRASALDRLGRSTLTGYLALAVVTLIGVAASLMWDGLGVSP